MTLHRHWIWANIMREDFYEELKRNPSKPENGDDFYPDRQGAYMSLWYGMLFGVLEVVKEKKIDIPGLDDLDNIYDSLRLFRNAVFHPQPEYWSHKTYELFKDEQSAIKIRKVHSSLGKYFLECLREDLQQKGVNDGTVV